VVSSDVMFSPIEMPQDKLPGKLQLGFERSICMQ